MGVSIFYSGQLRDPAEIPALVRDLTARAEAAGWPVKAMPQLIAEGVVADHGLEGVTLYPHPECEPLRFHFDAEGRFIDHHFYTLLHDREKAVAFVEALQANERAKKARRARDRGVTIEAVAEAAPEEPAEAIADDEHPCREWCAEACVGVSVKTQFAGAPTHVAACALLRHIKDRYAPDLEVRDDTGFFDHGDLNRLRGELAGVDALLGAFRRAVETAASEGVAPGEALIARAGQLLFAKKDGAN